MHEEIITQLKKYSDLRPDAEFVRRTRNLFDHTSPSRKVPRFTLSFPMQWRIAGAFAFVLILFVIILPLSVPEPTLASLNSDALAEEITNLPITIQLKEINYNKAVEQTINSAITEVSNTSMNHLNASILKKEETSIQHTIDQTQTGEIDALLKEASK